MRLMHEERGVAMATVVMLLMVLSLLGIVAVQVINHTVALSGRGRDRVAALHAAEAGVNEAIRQLASDTGSTWCGVSASASTILPGGGGAPGGQQYAVVVSDSDASDGACSADDPVRLVTATGYSPSASATDPLVRVMEAEIRLVPKTAALAGGFVFDRAVLANSFTTPLNIGNSVSVNGDGTGNNGDLYSNDDIILPNSNKIYGDVVSQGAITMQNSVEVFGNVWANGNVSLENSAIVHGNVTSATGSISLINSARINGSARAATTITIQNSSVIVGAQYPNSPSSAPAVETLPTFTWDASDPSWPQPVTQHANCSAFTTYLNANKDDFEGTHRVLTDCGTALANSLTVKLSDHAAIVMDGWMTMENSVTFEATGSGDRSLTLISLHESTGSGDKKGIELGNSVEIKVPVLIYAKNYATKTNSVSLTGQIYADKVSITNSYTHTYYPLTAPGFSSNGGGSGTPPAGFTTQVLYLREI